MTTTTRSEDPVRSLLQAADPQGVLAPCGMQRLVLGSGVVGSVADVVDELVAVRGERAAGSSGRPRVALVVDTTPILRAGQDVKQLVEALLRERFEVQRVVLDDGHATLHVTDAVVAAAEQGTSGVDAVVAVGGGTISDLGKLSSCGTTGARPALVTVQTAASVDGFTNDMSVVLRDGVKRTVPSRWPDAVVADTETVVGAPERLTRAGYGEMTSMLVAPADWRLAALVGADHTFDDAAIRVLRAVGAGVEDWSAGVGRGDPEAVASLARALGLRGVVGGIARTTAVLSGIEHLVSHMLDQHHAAHHLPTGLHGAQVGVASVLAAAAWELFFDRMDGARTTPALQDGAFDRRAAHERVTAAFGPLDPSGAVAGECWRDVSAKLDDLARERPRIEALLTDWTAHRNDLARLVRPSVEIAAGLRAAGASATFTELDPAVPEPLARWALANCGLMRRRVTLVDLLTLLGWWTAADVDEVFRRAAAAVAAVAPAETVAPAAAVAAVAADRALEVRRAG